MAEQRAARRLKAVDETELFQDSRKTIRSGIIVIALFFGVFGGWAVLAPLAGAIIVEASVKVDSYRKTVQHLEGGIVREILVRNGDQVRQGQPLIILNDIQASATVDALRIQHAGEQARAARLRAEKGRQKNVVFPESLVKSDDSRFTALATAEQAAFDARRQLVDGQATLLRTQIGEVREEIKGLESQIKFADDYITYTREELVINERLHKESFVAYTRILTLKRQLVEKEEKRGEFVALVSQAKQKISERELRIITLYDNYVKEATEELRDVERRIADMDERLRPTQDQLKRLTIVAPTAGEVVGLKVTTVGGVIAPRESLMDIVPTHPRVVVEGRVKVEDIDEVAVGQPVDVMLSAYKRRTTPKVAGKVTYISGDSLTDPGTSAVPYYLIHVEVDPKSLAEIGNLPLTPGMPATAFLRTRERTFLHYILEPITDTLRRSMRES
jgi:HlyD family type I secretion membrane fusion protein